jgi:translocator protein
MMADHGWWPLIIAGAGATIVAVAGGLLTEVGSWYRGLKSPSWKPPDWAFGPVWTVILSLCAYAVSVAWRDAPSETMRSGIIAMFAINAVLHVAWSLLFFKLKRPDWSLIEVAALWLSVLAPVIAFSTYSSLAALLLAPYLVWVAVAAYLNYEMVRLNRPFA